MRHSCQETWKALWIMGSRQNGQRSGCSFKKTANRKTPYCLYTDGSVTKDQSGWGFTVKQGATTIREDSAAYTVSASSLTIEVEAVRRALRWIASRGNSRTTHVILLTDSMSLLQKVKCGMGSPDWNVSMVDIHLPKLLLVYCPGHAGVKGNDRADRLAGKASLTSGLPLRRSEMLKLETLPVGTKPRTSHHR